MQTAPMYRLTPARAIEIVQDVERATSAWRVVATRAGIAPRELELMVAAFDTAERTAAHAIVARHRTASRPVGRSGVF